MSSLYLDESKSKRYAVAAVAVEDADASPARKALVAFRKKGQRRMHFVQENDSRRREALALLSDLGMKATLFIAPVGMTQLDARAECLTSLVERLPASKPSRIILEQDDSMVDFDKRVLSTAVNARKARSLVSFTHARAVEEPLLWIPDAIVWSYIRGGDFRRRADELILDVVEIATTNAKLGRPTVRKVAELTSRR